MTISAIIVTFNRKDLVLRCIDAVLNQTHKVENLIIVDNCSTDGTVQAIFEKYGNGQFDSQKEKLLSLSVTDGVSVYIYPKSENTGGSGGFHKGMEIAFEKFATDFYWMMDDDGYPTEECLEKLISISHKKGLDYVMPVSIDIDNHENLSWATRKRNGKKTIVYRELKDSWGEILDYVTPFNGVLLTKKCVSEVGYINKDFFIWGDEYEHYWRCRSFGVSPVTDLDAVFYHPAAKLPLVPICFGLFRVPYTDSSVRMICLARNYTYIYLHYDKKIKIPIKFLMYFWLFMFTRHGDFNGFKLYCQSVKDGFKGDFTRHLRYLNNQKQGGRLKD